MDRRPCIAALLPSATEIVAAVGLGEFLVGITHECDFPVEAVRGRQVVTTSEISPYALSQGQINDLVVGSLRQGHSLYSLNVDVLKEMKPTHFITQSLCDVCAVSSPLVESTTSRIFGDGVKIISLAPGTLDDVIDSISAVGKAFEQWGAVAMAEQRVDEFRRGIDLIQRYVACRHETMKVAFCEWLDPVFTGGHWIPDMLRIAGAKYDMAQPGERSKPWSSEELVAYDPDIIVVGCCGFDVDRNKNDTLNMAQSHPWFRQLRAVQTTNVYAVDANSYFARPGPRLLQGLGILAGIIHGPDLRSQLPNDLCPEAGWTQIVFPTACCREEGSITS